MPNLTPPSKIKLPILYSIEHLQKLFIAVPPSGNSNFALYISFWPLTANQIHKSRFCVVVFFGGGGCFVGGGGGWGGTCSLSFGHFLAIDIDMVKDRQKN